MALLAHSADSFGCWSCPEGQSQEDCSRGIRKSQLPHVEALVAKNQEFCDGKDAGLYNKYLGRELGMISTDPQVAVYCTGEGDRGWVAAKFAMKAQFEYFPLGSNSPQCASDLKCAKEQAALRKAVLQKVHPMTELASAASAGELADPSGELVAGNGEKSGSSGRKPASTKEETVHAPMQPAETGATGSEIAASPLGDPAGGVSSVMLFTFTK